MLNSDLVALLQRALQLRDCGQVESSGGKFTYAKRKEATERADEIEQKLRQVIGHLNAETRNQNG